MSRGVDFALWPFMFLCLNGCYGPPQTLRGQVERLPENSAVLVAPGAAEPATDDELVQLAKEIADPLVWAGRAGPPGSVDLKPVSFGP